MTFFFKNKMEKTVDKFLYVGDKFMPEMHLEQPEFTYSACGPFTKNKEGIRKLMEKRRDKEIKLLILQAIQNMMVIKEDQLQ